jgi:hypothetical protein
MKHINVKTLILSLLSIPYFLLFAYYAWNLAYRFQEDHVLLGFKMFFGGLLFFSPYLFFIIKNSKEKIINFKTYGKLGLVTLSIMSLIFILLISFYMVIIGKMINLEGLFSFVKYSLLPPLFMVYAIPYFVYTYSKDKEPFYVELKKFLRRFGNS